MKTSLRVMALLLAGALLGACGGTGDGAAGNPAGGGASPPAVAVAGGWDTWNWDEGVFSE